MKNLENTQEGKIWINLSSRSGKTYGTVCKVLDKIADIYFPPKISVDQTYYWLRTLPYDSKDVIITLMGFMRIVPADICEMFEIYNLHPAPINLPDYRWLKGKDPIERFWTERADDGENYLYGSVIHHVTAGVDEGKVIRSRYFAASSLEDCYNKSFATNVLMWSDFLSEKLGCGLVLQEYRELEKQLCSMH